jgi:hypothetical protein
MDKRINCQPYTSLFDIGRSSIDGRTMQNYIEWLKATLKIFPNLIVFHDGSCDSLNLEYSNFVKISKDNLDTFKLKDQVSQILNSFRPISSGDITFKLVEYSLVQYAKFELGEKVLEISDCSSVLWIDAGISRFIKSPRFQMLEANVENLLKYQTKMVLEIDIRNNFNWRNLSIETSMVGSCRRVISGTSFWINSDFLIELNILIRSRLLGWIRAGIWDNEQVLLRNLLPLDENICYIPQIYQSTGSVARKLSSEKLVLRPWLNHLIDGSISRGNLQFEG